VVVQSITGEISASKLFHRIQLLLEVCYDPDWTNKKLRPVNTTEFCPLPCKGGLKKRNAADLFRLEDV
jgi:hypothetical protein